MSMLQEASVKIRVCEGSVSVVPDPSAEATRRQCSK